MPALTLEDCRTLDAGDSLAPLRKLFHLREGLIYLDGNSLGALPKATPQRIAEVVTEEWGNGLIVSWNKARWVDLPQRVGNRVATLVGAQPGELVCTDSTSINLYKVLHAALSMARQQTPERKVVLSERSNFPTDLYIAEGLCRERGFELKLVDADALTRALTADVAVLMLTHVNYRTGAMHDMAALTTAAHAAGALAIWDLAHSAGAVPVHLHEADADFAVGCGYKYLNGGPGAPAFVWVHPRHANRCWQPLSGWWGHEAPFAFVPDYRPAAGIARYLCGTQPILSLAALEVGLECFDAAAALGGMTALRVKSLALSDLFIELVETRCAGHGLSLVTPREPARRGSQICLTRRADAADAGESGAYAIVQALIARGVVGDFRAGDRGEVPPDMRMPDILRFGLTPMYLGFADVWQAVEHLRDILDTGVWRQPEFVLNDANAVT